MEPSALPTPPLQIDRWVAPIAFPDPAIEKALRAHLFPAGSNPEACQRQGGLRYIYNRVDLDGDRAPETLVALLGRQGCAKGGCPVMLFKGVGPRIRPVQTLLGFHTALIVAERQRDGWRDLILPEPDGAGGGRSTWLSHNGKSYPLAPSIDSTGALPTSIRGVAALVVKESPYLVQGHSLDCLPPAGQRKRVFNKLPMALPSSSLPLEETPLRPAI
jgi:hypothetical protein